MSTTPPAADVIDAATADPMKTLAYVATLAVSALAVGALIRYVGERLEVVDVPYDTGATPVDIDDQDDL